jgi:ADP-ribose pyrophosphatase
MRDDLIDLISRFLQRQGQRVRQVSCPHYCDSRLGSHAGQHNRESGFRRPPLGLLVRDLASSIRKPETPAAEAGILFGMRKSTSSHSSRSRQSSSKKIQPGKKARLISSRTVYQGPVFWVTTDHVQEPGGVRVRRDLIHHSGSVVVLAVEDSGKTPRLLLERQYRHAANDYLWELPAGRIDPGEGDLEAAKRELIEETGYRAANWRRIFKFYSTPGFLAETMSVFLATGLRTGEAEPEEDEVIYMRMVELPVAVKMVLRGTIRDAKTISSVLWLDHMRRTGTSLTRSGRRNKPKR